MTRWFILLTLVASTQMGCFTGDPDLIVEVCGDVVVSDEVDAVRVIVYDDQRTEEVASGSKDLLSCPDGKVGSLPITLEIPEVPQDAWVVLEGLKDGVPIVTFERRLRGDDESEVEAIMGLTRDCIGLNCPLGQTCYGGECKVVEFDSGEQVCKSTGEVPPLIPSEEPLCPEVTIPGEEVTIPCEQ